MSSSTFYQLLVCSSLFTQLSISDVILCSSGNPCIGNTITCAKNETCSVTCSSDESCRSKTINCPFHHSCVVNCDGQKACDSATINALNSSKLILQGCTASDSCWEINIYCPPFESLSNTYGCTIFGDNSIGDHNIYAVNGFNDISFNLTASVLIFEGTLHCGPPPSYSDTCTLDTISDYSNPVCAGSTPYACMPTQSPTSNPSTATNYPSSMPSSSPTSNPSNYPSSMPTLPTVYPTIEPSNEPSADPTIVPTSHPTIPPSYYPTAYPTAIPTFITSFYPTLNPILQPTDFPTNKNYESNIKSSAMDDLLPIILGLIAFIICLAVLLVYWIKIQLKKKEKVLAQIIEVNDIQRVMSQKNKVVLCQIIGQQNEGLNMKLANIDMRPDFQMQPATKLPEKPLLNVIICNVEGDEENDSSSSNSEGKQTTQKKSSPVANALVIDTERDRNENINRNRNYL